MGKKIVLAAFGSLGDLHPYIALGKGLQARGHEVVIATFTQHRPLVEAQKLRFQPMRPDQPNIMHDPERMAYFMDLRKGVERLLKEFILPSLKESYLDLLVASDGADFLVTHPLTFSAGLVAEKLGISWARCFLQPMSLFSIYDPPIVPPRPLLNIFRPLGPLFYRPVFDIMRRVTVSWGKPWHALRAEVGLPVFKGNALFEGQHSPYLNLALFSELFAKPQTDWPAHTQATGFAMFDQAETLPSPELTTFLAAGPPPVVFTRGSAAVWDAKDFFRISAAAAETLGLRALLVIGNDDRNALSDLPKHIMTVPYAAFSKIFPLASVVVHQCGVGTCAQSLYAGRPVLMAPHAFDQPDNADRLAKLGVGRVVPRGRYQHSRVVKELRELLANPSYAANAAELARKIRREDGVANACQAIERVL